MEFKRMNSFGGCNRIFTREYTKTLDDIFYRLSTECYNNKIGAIFKGGCLLRHILREHRISILRGTKDLDFDLYADSYEKLEVLLENEARFSEIRENLKLNLHLTTVNIDCDVKLLDDMIDYPKIVYKCSLGRFWGVPLEDMLSDKICSMSTNMIIRRNKDLYDIYVITKDILDVDTDEVYRMCEAKGWGDFKAFRSRNREMINGLSQLTNSVDNVIHHVESFVYPLLDGTTKHWNGRIWI